MTRAGRGLLVLLRPGPRPLPAGRARRRAAGGVQARIRCKGRDGEELAMDVARDRPPRCRQPADRQQRLPWRRGLSAAAACRCRRLRDAQWRDHAAAARRGRALHPRAQPLRLLAHSPDHPRERGPEPQFPRFLQAAAGERGLPRDPALAAARTNGRPRRPTSDAIARYIAAHGAGRLPGGHDAAASTSFPTACSSAARAPTWSNLALREVLRAHGRRAGAHRLDRHPHRPGPQRRGRADLCRAATTRPTLRAHGVVGRRRARRRSPRSTTARRPRRS